MRLSTKTRYGLRAMVEIALSQGGGPIQIKLISEKQDISSKYLEQLIAMLKSAGLVRSVRGPHGGYVLARPAEQITLLEIIKALEGSLDVVDCIDENPNICSKVADCVTRQVWIQIHDTLESILKNQTLGDLVAKSNKKKTDYQI